MRRQRYSLTPLACGLILLLNGCAGSSGHHHRHGGADSATATPPPLPTVSARQGSVQQRLQIAGYIAPLLNVSISNTLSEPATEVDVLQGDRVVVGQRLALLEHTDLDGQLAALQGSLQAAIATAADDDAKVAQARYTAHLNRDTGGNQLNAANAALAQARQTLVNDQNNLVRDRQLSVSGYIPQQTLDQQATLVNNDAAAVRSAEAAVATAKTTVTVNGTSQSGLQQSTLASAIAEAQAAHANIASIRGQIDQLQAQIAHTQILSPVNGIVVNRNLNPGEYPSGRTLFTVQRLDQVYVDLNASSSDIFGLTKGAPIHLDVSGASHDYTGRVVAILGQVTPGSTNFTVQGLIANPDGHLQSGLPATATITLPTVRGIEIPTTAFLDETHRNVMRMSGDGAQRRFTKTGVREIASNGTDSIITGLAAGSTIVANGQLDVQAGQGE